jgi:release factor glutamine methyltransferase
VLDVGTGSGAIALALAQERPDLQIGGSDVSEDALSLARENAARLGLDVHFVHADLLEGVEDEYDAVLANLPYIAERERATLAPEILRHEPPGALFAGVDGLDALRALIGGLSRSATARLLALEVGQGQAPVVGRLLDAAGFAKVACMRDLAGIERVVTAERSIARATRQGAVARG